MKLTFYTHLYTFLNLIPLDQLQLSFLCLLQVHGKEILIKKKIVKDIPAIKWVHMKYKVNGVPECI